MESASFAEFRCWTPPLERSFLLHKSLNYFDFRCFNQVEKAAYFIPVTDLTDISIVAPLRERLKNSLILICIKIPQILKTDSFNANFHVYEYYG